MLSFEVMGSVGFSWLQLFAGVDFVFWVAFCYLLW